MGLDLPAGLSGVYDMVRDEAPWSKEWNEERNLHEAQAWMEVGSAAQEAAGQADAAARHIRGGGQQGR
ncbi:hypothetical protein GCM10022224_056030 [Nonomuraea antimicrobica]|uniref:Uncharacterized protein n=1 Tax=Nonomuraea antimicrobica TaxID=561173 RepID=A0ABP7CCN4_9ACTN